MAARNKLSRRGFVGASAAALGYLGIAPGALASGKSDWRRSGNRDAFPGALPLQDEAADYDSLIKLNYNENPYGPSEPVLEAMTEAFKYSMRYNYPDHGVVDAIAAFHGVSRENILLGAGSGEILEVVGLTYLQNGKKIVGMDPTFGAVYQHASGINAEAIKVPLNPDYSQNIPALIEATNKNYRDVGFVYICNPNNPTGMCVSAAEIRELLDGIPVDVPVLIDEAYHHFVEDPTYATSIPYVVEGRKVIIARTFSKLYGMAAIRLGFAISTPEMIDAMNIYTTGSISAQAKWGAVAAMEDTRAQQRVRDVTIALRKKTSADLVKLGYEVIPSETNFFMLRTGRQAREVIAEFRKRDIVVGRPFPPMLEYIRVSIGTEEEMGKFMVAFKEIFEA